ncbi:hypothetical protein Tco_0718085, partial [Tanacetum coccineum]
KSGQPSRENVPFGPLVAAHIEELERELERELVLEPVQEQELVPEQE